MLLDYTLLIISTPLAFATALFLLMSVFGGVLYLINPKFNETEKK